MQLPLQFYNAFLLSFLYVLLFLCFCCFEHYMFLYCVHVCLSSSFGGWGEGGGFGGGHTSAGLPLFGNVTSVTPADLHHLAVRTGPIQGDVSQSWHSDDKTRAKARWHSRSLSELMSLSHCVESAWRQIISFHISSSFLLKQLKKIKIKSSHSGHWEYFTAAEV